MPNHRSNFEAVVIAEPDAVAMAGAIGDTNANATVASAMTFETKISDDEVSEKNDASIEEDHLKPLFIASSDVPEKIPVSEPTEIIEDLLSMEEISASEFLSDNK